MPRLHVLAIPLLPAPSSVSCPPEPEASAMLLDRSVPRAHDAPCEIRLHLNDFAISPISPVEQSPPLKAESLAEQQVQVRIGWDLSVCHLSFSFTAIGGLGIHAARLRKGLTRTRMQGPTTLPMSGS